MKRHHATTPPRHQSKTCSNRKRVVFITGPTASGKSEVALALAGKLGAEIISSDSMQIYKGIEILSSQPQPSVRKKVPHHLLAFISPRKEYNVSRYIRDANKKVKSIIKKGKLPLFVGGTGLYMATIIDGIFKDSGKDEALRKKLYKQSKTHGVGFLHARLTKIDPVAASRIHPNDTKRIIRALEVFETTGKPISQLQKEKSGGLSEDYDIKIFCLNLKRSALYRRIEKRVDVMFKRGILEEVKKLLSMPLSKTASYAIGIRELEGYFAGRYDLEEAKELIKRNTRLYAKRQLTWFRKDKRIEWVEIGDKEKSSVTVERIFKKLI